MIKKTCFFLFVLLSLQGYAQTGIGTITPNASAKLDVFSDNKGFLPPRVTLTSISVFLPIVGTSSAATGLLVYNTATAGTIPNNVIPGYYYWSGTAWIRLIVPTDNASNVTGAVAVANGGTGTTTGSIIGSGALTFTAGGSNQNISLSPSGTGNIFLNNNVSIGTTSVGDRLLIGSFAVHDGGNKVIALGYSPGSGKTLLAGFPSEIRLDPSSGRLSFGTSATSFLEGAVPTLSTRMSITSQGNIGIGTESPSVRLQVSGDIIANSIAGSSDERFKTNISTIVNPLQKVLQLRGLTFDWKTKEFPDRAFSENRSLGFIAQEVERVLPEVVYTEKTSEGYKSIQYDKVVALLVEAIKEQQRQIQELKKEIKKIKNSKK